VSTLLILVKLPLGSMLNEFIEPFMELEEPRSRQ
jgi:hypothetical protein